MSTTLAQKKKLLKLAIAHQKADEFIKGSPQNCSVGCSTQDAMRLEIIPEGHAYSHGTISELWGVPLQVAHLFDAIFEGLTREDSRAWTPRWQRAIVENSEADFSLVWPQFSVWCLLDEKHGVRQFAKGFPDCKAAIDRVATLWQRVIAGESVESLQAEFRGAAWAARAARNARQEFWSAAADKLESLLREAK